MSAQGSVTYAAAGRPPACRQNQQRALTYDDVMSERTIEWGEVGVSSDARTRCCVRSAPTSASTCIPPPCDDDAATQRRRV